MVYRERSPKPQDGVRFVRSEVNAPKAVVHSFLGMASGREAKNYQKNLVGRFENI